MSVKPGTRGAIASMHIGQRFGTRTIRGFLVRPASEGGTVVELDCDCGTPGVAFPRKLAAGLDRSCPRCADRRRASALRRFREIASIVAPNQTPVYARAKSRGTVT